jgi:hypothetical protein
MLGTQKPAESNPLACLETETQKTHAQRLSHANAGLATGPIVKLMATTSVPNVVTEQLRMRWREWDDGFNYYSGR